MTTPTRQEIINAHKELKKLCDRVPATNLAREVILKALPQLPSVTMNEVEWDEIEHRLRVALYHDGNIKVIMLGETFDGKEVFCLVEHPEHSPYVKALSKYLLTPLNWNYTLEGKE